MNSPAFFCVLQCVLLTSERSELAVTGEIKSNF